MNMRMGRGMRLSHGGLSSKRHHHCDVPGHGHGHAHGHGYAVVPRRSERHKGAGVKITRGVGKRLAHGRRIISSTDMSR